MSNDKTYVQQLKASLDAAKANGDVEAIKYFENSLADINYQTEHELTDFDKYFTIIRNYRDYHQAAKYPELKSGMVIGKIDWASIRGTEINSFSKVGVIAEEVTLLGSTRRRFRIFVVNTDSRQSVKLELWEANDIYPVTEHYLKELLSEEQLTMVNEISSKYPRENLPAVNDICKVMKYVDAQWYPYSQFSNNPVTVVREVVTPPNAFGGNNDVEFSDDNMRNTNTQVEIAYVNQCNNRRNKLTVSTAIIDRSLLEKIEEK